MRINLEVMKPGMERNESGKQENRRGRSVFPAFMFS
jgi:hypothetical protein